MTNPGLRFRIVLRAAAVSSLLGVALLAVGGSQAASRVKARAAAAGISFSHAVVVDHQRPGFEPDVKADTAGTIYTSIPFGFSTTESFVWDSLDHGNSYQFVPGNIATTGKQPTCFGGGDSDLFLDARNSLYFSDLQGLSNISNSRSDDKGTTWSTTCAGAPNTPDDRMWFAGTGSFAGGNLNLYQDYDAVANSTSGNVLVETISHDGASTFQPVVPTNPDSSCGLSIHDCVTSNEGISGNQVVDPGTGNVFIAHTSTENSSGTPGVRIAEGKITPGTPTTATWTESPNLVGPLCPDPNCVDSNGNAEEIAGENFATVARDAAGYLYVTFTAGPIDHASSNDPNFGALTAPEQIYVVHSLEPATMTDPSQVTWSAPQRITGSGLSAGTNTFPWITAGSDGRAAVAWYHTNETSEQGTCASGSGTCTLFGASSLSNAEWSVQMAQSLNAHDPSPGYSTADVSEAFVKQGQICTSGIGCSTGGDRSLGDFLQISTDPQGAALVSYVFDTSRDINGGQSAGPEVVSRQISGPSLLASAGDVTQGAGPGTPMGAVGDPTGDAAFSANGARTPGGDSLDLTGASLGNGANRTLTAKIDVKSLASLATPGLAAGGPDASWILRWTDVVPGTSGNGHIYYLGMDNNQGAGGSGTPSFFVGDTSSIPTPNSNPQLATSYITYPQSKTLSSSQASYNSKTGVISFHIPLSDVGNPANGTVLYSGTAFSATAASPQSSTTVFNLIDATTPFELVIGPPGSVGTTPSGPPPFSSTNGGRGACAKATGRLSGLGLGKLRLRMARAAARRAYPRWSTRGRRYMEFYCVTPIGIRAGYPSNSFLRSLSGGLRRAVRGRTVLVLTANRHYALKGVRPGARLSKVRRRLKIGRGYRIGRNTWYLTPNGASHGLIKVQHGVIEEVGIVDKQLTSRGYRKTFRFLNSFRPVL
jgi:hypothetical protein